MGRQTEVTPSLAVSCGKYIDCETEKLSRVSDRVLIKKVSRTRHLGTNKGYTLRSSGARKPIIVFPRLHRYQTYL